MMTVWTPVEMTLFVLILMGLANATGFYFGRIKGIEVTMRFLEGRGINIDLLKEDMDDE